MVCGEPGGGWPFEGGVKRVSSHWKDVAVLSGICWGFPRLYFSVLRNNCGEIDGQRKNSRNFPVKMLKWNFSVAFDRLTFITPLIREWISNFVWRVEIESETETIWCCRCADVRKRPMSHAQHVSSWRAYRMENVILSEWFCCIFSDAERMRSRFKCDPFKWPIQLLIHSESSNTLDKCCVDCKCHCPWRAYQLEWWFTGA